MTKRKCDRCGKRYTPAAKAKHNNTTYPQFNAVSERCIERVWEVCDKCLGEIINFMDNPCRLKAKILVGAEKADDSLDPYKEDLINPRTYCIDCTVALCFKDEDGFLAHGSHANKTTFRCPRKKRCFTWKEVKEEKARIKKENKNTAIDRRRNENA